MNRLEIVLAFIGVFGVVYIWRLLQKADRQAKRRGRDSES